MKENIDLSLIGIRIRFFRGKIGISKSQLANKSGVSVSHLNRLESGKRKVPSLEVAN